MDAIEGQVRMRCIVVAGVRRQQLGQSCMVEWSGDRGSAWLRMSRRKRIVVEEGLLLSFQAFWIIWSMCCGKSWAIWPRVGRDVGSPHV